MPPSVDPSSPGRVDAAVSAASVTTASFTPPAGALLVAAVQIDAGTAPAPTLSMTSSPALTWTKPAEQTTGGEVGAAVFLAVAPAGTPLTATFTTSNSDNKSLKVWVITDYDTANPTGDVTAGIAAVDLIAIPGLVATRPDSLGIYAAAQDESATTAPTSPETVFEPVLISGQVAGGSGPKLMGPAGAETTYSIDAAGATVCSWHYVGVEILAVPGAPRRRRRSPNFRR